MPKPFTYLVCLYSCLLSAILTGQETKNRKVKSVELLETASNFWQAASDGSLKLSQERQSRLQPGVKALRSELNATGKANLLFVCTHNSRRSHLAQVWSAVAAANLGHSEIQSYSCGTEATACNPRTVASLRRSGLSVVMTGQDQSNPIYLLQYSENAPTLPLFSKAFGDASLPSRFIALMCCDDADEKCPVISGAVSRVALSYVDPKVSDSTSQEAATYDQRSLQIASEMIYLVRGALN